MFKPQNSLDSPPQWFCQTDGATKDVKYDELHNILIESFFQSQPKQNEEIVLNFDLVSIQYKIKYLGGENRCRKGISQYV